VTAKLEILGMAALVANAVAMEFVDLIVDGFSMIPRKLAKILTRTLNTTELLQLKTALEMEKTPSEVKKNVLLLLRNGTLPSKIKL
jgi:hypothetical protein